MLLGIALVGCDLKKNTVSGPIYFPNYYQKNTWGIGGNLEDVIPGTAVSKLSNHAEIYQALLQSLGSDSGSSGTAAVQAHSSTDYIVQTHFNGQATINRSQNQAKPPETLVPQYVIEVSGKSSSDDISLSLYSAQTGSKSYTYALSMKQYGLNLASTDQVALFIATTDNDNFEIIKVGFRQSNPLLQWFTIEVSPDPSNTEGKYLLHVVSRILQTQFRSITNGGK